MSNWQPWNKNCLSSCHLSVRSLDQTCPLKAPRETVAADFASLNGRRYNYEICSFRLAAILQTQKVQQCKILDCSSADGGLQMFSLVSGEPEHPAKLEPLQMFNGKQDAKFHSWCQSSAAMKNTMQTFLKWNLSFVVFFSLIKRAQFKAGHRKKQFSTGRFVLKLVFMFSFKVNRLHTSFNRKRS